MPRSSGKGFELPTTQSWIHVLKSFSGSGVQSLEIHIELEPVKADEMVDLRPTNAGCLLGLDNQKFSVDIPLSLKHKSQVTVVP
jgi:hypothetical protein